MAKRSHLYLPATKTRNLKNEKERKRPIQSRWSAISIDSAPEGGERGGARRDFLAGCLPGVRQKKEGRKKEGGVVGVYHRTPGKERRRGIAFFLGLSKREEGVAAAYRTRKREKR